MSSSFPWEVEASKPQSKGTVDWGAQKVSQAPGLLSLGAPFLGALTPSSENAEAEGPGALCLTPG